MGRRPDDRLRERRGRDRRLADRLFGGDADDRRGRGAPAPRREHTMTETFAERVASLTEVRARHPEAVAEAAAARSRRPALLGPSGRLMIVAADHPARGALAAGDRPLAMADRTELLRRLCVAL